MTTKRHSSVLIRAIAITLTAAATVGYSARSDASSLVPLIDSDSPTQLKSGTIPNSAPNSDPNSEILMAEIEFHLLPDEVRAQVLQFAAEDLGVPLEQLNVERHSRETWTDGCLGLGGPAESCMMMLVEGWQIEVVHENNHWFYRTDLTGDSIRRSTYAQNLPPSVGDRLLSMVATDHNIPLEQLQVVEAEPQIWNGCLGITPANGICTRQAIWGWRAIVRAGQPEPYAAERSEQESSRQSAAQYWIYHTDNSGQMIRLNAIATPPEGIRPTFISRVDPFELDDETIFEMVMTGSDRQVVLLEADGKLIKPSPEPDTETPEVYNVSDRQFERLTQLLSNTPFQDFDGIAYQRDRQMNHQIPDISEPAADAPTIILRNRLGETQFTPEVQDDLPPKLQQILRRWNRLAKM
ncbi:MAG: hypothetical protein WBA57_17790 [Elainellaceae cyanobacterium]